MKCVMHCNAMQWNEIKLNEMCNAMKWNEINKIK